MKDLKISKELLSEVLKSPVEIISIDECKCMIKNSIYFDNEQMGISYRYLYGNKEIRFMSIYEFAFKCKEWAYKNFKIMLISHYAGQCYINGDLSPLELNWWNNTKSYQIESDTEVEAILKACQWILENIK